MSDHSARRDPATATTEAPPGGPARPVDFRGTTGCAPSRYRILDPVGIGGMGIVYRAEDTRLGRRVALKFPPPAASPRDKELFLNEARTAAALDHLNICTIHEVGESAEGRLYLVMACYEGATLKQRLEGGPLPAAAALHIALQVACGLAKAHRHGIVHRDVKPANLMITVEGIVKILDFGIARLPGESQAGAHPGTPGYMAPEQAKGGTVDARSDVWSLGIVLREMLTGWRPGRGHQPVPPPLPPDAPPGLAELLSRMLARDPAERHPDAAALLPELAALERAAAGAEGAPTAAPARRFPAWAVVLTAAALVVASIAWKLRDTGQPARPGASPGQVTLTQLTDLPGKERFPGLSPAGDFFVYARKAGDGSRLFLQEIGGGPPRDLLPGLPAGGSQPALSPDGRQVAFRSEHAGGGIFVLDLEGGGPVRPIAGLGFNPAWSPHGDEIVFATEGVDGPSIRRHPSQLYRAAVATGQRRPIHAGDAVQPSWSPHGLRIAYWRRTPSGDRVIETVPAAGGEAVEVTTGEDVDWHPVWSPDGHHLYFASDRSGINNLWRVPIDERSGRTLGDPEPVATSGAILHFSFTLDPGRLVYASAETRTVLEKVAFDPVRGAVAGPAAAVLETSNKIAALDVSRDGQWLVYQTSLPQEDLFVVRTDGTGLRRLTDDKHRDRLPRWSPDGTRIAFYSNRGDRYEVWTIQADGNRLERVAVLPHQPAYHPIWSHDGRSLACNLGTYEALIDLDPPVEERRPRLLPPAEQGLGFSASSWSRDGRWLAGALQQGEQALPGIVLYSLAGRRYRQVTERGDSATWLSDSRRLLYREGGRILLLDTVTRAARPVLTTPPEFDLNDFSVSPDDRTVYLARDTEQGDVWLLTLR